MEHQSQPPEGLAARSNRLPSGGCSHEAAVADGLDEQLYETCGSIFPHSISSSTLARRLSLVPGKICMDRGTKCTHSGKVCWLPLF